MAGGDDLPPPPPGLIRDDSRGPMTALPVVDPAKDRVPALLLRALKTGARNALLAYNIRAGVGVLMRALTLLRTEPASVLSLQRLLSEKDLSFRVDAGSLALFVGGFTGVMDAVRSLSCVLRATGGKADGLDTALGAAAGGSALLFLEPSRRRTLALYMAVRAVQCAYNAAKVRGWWHLWGSDWAHGDSLLFILSSAQVMYAYVMRPLTLPPSYLKFIVNTGPVHRTVLAAVCAQNRGQPVDVPALQAFAAQHGPGAAEALARGVGEGFRDGVTCQVSGGQAGSAEGASRARRASGERRRREPRSAIY